MAPCSVEVRAECSPEIAIPIEVTVDGCLVGVQATSPAESTVKLPPVSIAEITSYGVAEDSYVDVSTHFAGECDPWVFLCDGWRCEF